MRTVLCDASPLTFLAKLDRLHLVPDLLGDRTCVLRLVVDEVCRADAPPVEFRRLNRFLKGIEVIDFTDAGHTSQSLSRSDRATLNWAIRNQPDHLLVDERLLRRVAVAEGLTVIGTLGLLFMAERDRILTKTELRTCLEDLAGKYEFRISVDLYQRILRELESL